jgi:hypothetical protein
MDELKKQLQDLERWAAFGMLHSSGVGEFQTFRLLQMKVNNILALVKNYENCGDWSKSLFSDG